MFFVLLVSLYTSRVVLNVLGVSDYGVYNVVAGFVTLFSFLNSTLSASMQRFYNYEGGRRGNTGLKDVYYTGFYIHVLLAIVVFLLLESFGIWYINNVMVIDSNRISAANYLFQFSTISMVFLILQIPYFSLIISNEKMDYYAIVSVLDVILKLIVILLLPYLPGDKLIIYGSFFLAVSIIDFLLYYFYVKKNYNFLTLGGPIDKELFRNLLGFSGWNLIGTFAFMLKGQGVNLLLNSFFNTTINAARGVAFQVNNAISGFTSNITMAFKPQVVHSYASNEFERTKLLMFAETKYCYCLILILIIPVILEIEQLLGLWLGNSVPPYTNVFSVLVLLDLLLSTFNTPVTQVAFATGHITRYQIASSIVNLLLLPVCLIFLNYGFGASVVFVITIVFTIINQFICLVNLQKIFSFSYKEYVCQIIFPCLLLTITLPLLPYVVYKYMDVSFYRLVLVTISDLVISIPLFYFIMLNKREKEQCISFLKIKIDSYMKKS